MTCEKGLQKRLFLYLTVPSKGVNALNALLLVANKGWKCLQTRGSGMWNAVAERTRLTKGMRDEPSRLQDKQQTAKVWIRRRSAAKTLLERKERGKTENGTYNGICTVQNER
jgi:hypothetical protein